MVKPDLTIPQAELSERLQRLMFLRVLLVSLLLGASIFIQIRETKAYFGDIQTSHYVLTASVYLLTFIYLILLRSLKNLLRLAYAQLLADTFFTTALIYVTGGIESFFSFLYLLIITTGSVILYRRGGMIIASSCSILYGLLLNLHYYGIINPMGRWFYYSPSYQNINVFYIIIVNIGAFYLVAFLSSYPSEQARKGRVELKAKQDDIIKLEALNEWIIRSIASGLITLDDRNRIILFNPAAEEILSVKAEYAIGRSISEILPFAGNYLENGSSSLNPPIAPPQFKDIYYKKEDGDSLFLRFSISPLFLPKGEKGGLILSFQDQTKVKEIEEELKKVEDLALVGELAASIAHEIRNPMASISGSIQMLKESFKQDEVNKRLMDIILRETGRLDQLVDNFLVYCRPKPVKWEEFELNQLIKDSLSLFKNSGKWINRVEIIENLENPVIMESDAEQIRQILWNLFLNAIEAMPNGGALRISTVIIDNNKYPSQDKKMVKIVVQDTGEGFSEKALAHLFTPFFTTKQGGTGLGLPMVKKIIEGLKGDITGKNNEDGGAELNVSLPLVPPPLN